MVIKEIYDQMAISYPGYQKAMSFIALLAKIEKDG